MSSAAPAFRTRLRFSKKGGLKFVGHLDFLRAFGETVMRSGLPAAFSCGFNPHILLSFALPLPLGFESENDYADLALMEDVGAEEVAGRLNMAAPAGLFVKSAGPARDKCAAAVAAADYLGPAAGATAAAARQALAGPIVVQKKTKSGLRAADIRDDIMSAEVSGGEVLLRLRAGSGRFLGPLLAMEGLFGARPGPVGFCRLEMHRLENGRAVPLAVPPAVPPGGAP